MNVIEVNNLKKIYFENSPKSLVAVDNISFQVQKNEIFGLLGPNGAGKTTTLEIIEGLKKQTSGEVKVLNLDNLKQTQEIKRRIGVQLQSSDYLPHLSLGELIDLFAALYKQKADKKKLLSLVGLENKEKEVVKNLSGGQKQRFTIASSLVNKPEILFLDEPTTGLDPAGRRQLWQLTKNINSQGITILLTTHYMEEAEYLCHRVAIMDKGKCLTINKPHDLIEDIAHTTQISFFTPGKIDLKIFENLPFVEKVYSYFPKVIVEVKDLEHVDNLVKLLRKNNIEFSGFTVKTASLEDVYLDLTGHEFEE